MSDKPDPFLHAVANVWRYLMATLLIVVILGFAFLLLAVAAGS